MPGSKHDGSLEKRKVSKRSLLKWSHALAAVWILGIALGFSGNLLLGPNVTNATPGTASATPAATPPPTLTAKTPPVQGEQTSPSAIVDSVIQVAHAVNGVSVKSTHVEPVIPSETRQ